MSRQSALLLALLVSVSVNLLVAGVLIGRSSVGVRETPPAAWVARELEPEARRLVRDRLRQETGNVRPLRRDLADAHRAVREAMSAEDYDAQTLKDALARLRAVDGRYRQLLHDNVAEIAAQLPREQRVALLRAAMQRGGVGRIPQRPPVRQP
jgi:uncharacterized membrane protein